MLILLQFENKDEVFKKKNSKRNNKHTPTLILEFHAIYPVCSNSDVLTMVKREGGIECACINARACSAESTSHSAGHSATSLGHRAVATFYLP